MKTRSRVAFAAILATAALGAQAAEWSDAYLGFTSGAKFHEPGSEADVHKNVLTLEYVGGYKYGANFFTLDMLSSDARNPATGGSLDTPSARGAQEVYVVYNNTLSLTKATGSKVAYGPVRDVGLQAGFNYNAK